MTVRLLDRRLFNPPRNVDVALDGSWHPGLQRAWQLCDDDRGWMAQVEYVMHYDWGLGKHLEMVPAHRLRPAQPRTGWVVEAKAALDRD